MSTHTPGPWRQDATWRYSEPERDALMIYAGWDALALVQRLWRSGNMEAGASEAAANARLMAAAPELLAALSACLDRLAGVSGVRNPIGGARAAIAKATGEAPS